MKESDLSINDTGIVNLSLYYSQVKKHSIGHHLNMN